jgi:insulin-like growth factor 2 mRNA-binding protein 1
MSVPVHEGAPQDARRKVTVTGNPEAQWKAQYLIYEKLREEGFSGNMDDVKLTVEIRVPSSQVRLNISRCLNLYHN